MGYRTLRPFVATLTYVGLLTSEAGAYSIETAATVSCHEDITIAAWRQVSAAFPNEGRNLPARRDDEALIADVPFSVGKSLRSIGPVTLLLGVRDNDIKHFGPMDLRNLTRTASDPGGQAEHCLRDRDHDEPDGTRLAVEACRDFIRGKLVRALDGLDERGWPDTRKREQLRVALAIRDEIEVNVPLFFLNAGRALHAIQDSFTHSFRNPDDPGKIRVVLNFVDYTQDTLDEAVDGGSAGMIALLLGVAAVLRRRQRLAAFVLAGGAFVIAKPAQADEYSRPIDGPLAPLSGKSDGAVPSIVRGGAFFGRIAFGASYDNAALSGGLGMRYQMSPDWMLGFDGEWNPYIATTPGEIRSGAANAYLSLIRRFQLRWEAVNIRTTASLGASMLLFDLVGADKYSLGPYFGISFLGAELQLKRGVFLTVDPTYITIPVPSLKGVPFMYKQYRFLVGLEFGG